jgi:hypothetical protein
VKQKHVYYNFIALHSWVYVQAITKNTGHLRQYVIYIYVIYLNITVAVRLQFLTDSLPEGFHILRNLYIFLASFCNRVAVYTAEAFQFI